MAYQDHLTRQIERLGMVLRRLLTGLTGQRDPGEATVTMEQAEQTLTEALDLAPGELHTLSPQELVAAIEALPAYTEANVDQLADLLLALANAEPAHARLRREQALALLEHVNRTSATFNLERHSKVAQLRSRL